MTIEIKIKTIDFFMLRLFYLSLKDKEYFLLVQYFSGTVWYKKQMKMRMVAITLFFLRQEKETVSFLSYFFIIVCGLFYEKESSIHCNWTEILNVKKQHQIL